MLDNGKIMAANIRAERNRAKLTQKETADFLGISAKTYISYETDAKNVGGITFGLLACIFGCNVNNFYLHTKFTKCGYKN